MVSYSTDIANTWISELEGADFTIDADLQQLASNQDLVTAITNSLFCNRLALPSDELPNPFSDDRMGWWGDTYLAADPTVGQRLGSRIWLLMRSKSSTALLPTARQYAEESLAWLTNRKVASSFTVETYFIGNDLSKLAFKITVYQRGQPPLDLTYAWAWNQVLT